MTLGGRRTTSSSGRRRARSNGDLHATSGGNSVLGLIANNFVRVYHPCHRDRLRSTPRRSMTTSDRRRDPLAAPTPSWSTTTTAARSSSNLTVNGAIAQKYRGAVGTTGGTGFIKDYNYDDRLRYRSPPFFLEPVAASWHVSARTSRSRRAKARGPATSTEADPSAPRRRVRRGARLAGRAASRSAPASRARSARPCPSVLDLDAVEHVAAHGERRARRRRGP